MSAPSKNLLAATGLSIRNTNIHITSYYMSNHIINISNRLFSILSNPMMMNPLGVKYSFISIGIQYNNPIKQIYKSQCIKKLSINNKLAIINTFPAAYQAKSTRPSFGQLFPRNGNIPF